MCGPNASRCCPASHSSPLFGKNHVVPSEYTQRSKVVDWPILVKRTPLGPTCLFTGFHPYSFANAKGSPTESTEKSRLANLLDG